jgi:tetratricopeptide (TPR) repeat protein
MTISNALQVPAPTPEQRRIAAGQFERANQVVATGNYDYGIHLLLDCCKLDPANLLYRQALRRTEKVKYRNNLRGGLLSWLTTWPARARLKAARGAGKHLEILEHGERVLVRNPWDVGAQMDMAAAADALGLLDLAIWNLEQARQKQALYPALNRTLARLYEKRGHFTQAVALWELVRKAAPGDPEAAQKIKDLSAHETILRGQYGDFGSNGSSDSLRAGGPGAAAASPPADPVALEVAALRARLRADPTDAAAYLELAQVHRRAGQLDLAHQALTEGLAAGSSSFDLIVELTDLEIEPFRRNLAITEQRLHDRPDDPELRKIRLHLRKEVNTRELELYRKKADRFPTELSYRYEAGVRLLRAGQLDEAIAALQAARDDPRFRWQAPFYLGHCFKARGNNKLALRSFEEALAGLPDVEFARRKEVLFELARCHAEAGDLPRAVEVGTELAHLDFAYKNIAALLDEWQAQQPQAS